MQSSTDFLFFFGGLLLTFLLLSLVLKAMGWLAAAPFRKIASEYNELADQQDRIVAQQASTQELARHGFADQSAAATVARFVLCQECGLANKADDIACAKCRTPLPSLESLGVSSVSCPKCGAACLAAGPECPACHHKIAES